MKKKNNITLIRRSGWALIILASVALAVVVVGFIANIELVEENRPYILFPALSCLVIGNLVLVHAMQKRRMMQTLLYGPLKAEQMKEIVRDLRSGKRLWAIGNYFGEESVFFIPLDQNNTSREFGNIYCSKSTSPDVIREMAEKNGFVNNDLALSILEAHATLPEDISGEEGN